MEAVKTSRVCAWTAISRGQSRHPLMQRVGRLERRLDLVQVENHPFSRFGRETDACENLLELVVGPPAANVVGRFPDADNVERILTRGAVVAELTEGNGPSTLHDQRVPTVIHRLQFVYVADELRDEHCWHDARVEPKHTHMFRTLCRDEVRQRQAGYEGPGIAPHGHLLWLDASASCPPDRRG